VKLPSRLGRGEKVPGSRHGYFQRIQQYQPSIWKQLMLKERTGELHKATALSVTPYHLGQGDRISTKGFSAIPRALEGRGQFRISYPEAASAVRGKSSEVVREPGCACQTSWRGVKKNQEEGESNPAGRRSWLQSRSGNPPAGSRKNPLH
jgi:hypothetical protein